MTNLSLAKEYFDNLNTMITEIRRDLDLPELPIFIGSVISKSTLYQEDEDAFKDYKKTRPGIEYVFKAYFEAEEKIPNVKVVVAPDLEKHPKNVHFNTKGQLGLGKYFANAFLEFVGKK